MRAVLLHQHQPRRSLFDTLRSVRAWQVTHGKPVTWPPHQQVLDMYVLDVCIHILIASTLPLPTFYHYSSS